MSIYIPFTYIIGWSEHKKFYYGSKYAKGCQPSDLWESYFTSSEYVKKFREEFGEPDIIRIHRTFADKESCISFEFDYLTKIDAKNNSLFLNKSNSGRNMCKSEFTDKEKALERHISTCLKNWGVINPSQVKEIKDKKIKTSLENWGVEYSLQSPVVRNKGKQTCLEKYGSESHNSFPEIIEKKRESFIKNWGVEHYAQVQKECCYCGEIKSVRHEHKCPLNPNRKMLNVTGANNPRAKTYRIMSPDKKEFIIKTKKFVKEFAREQQISYNKLISNNLSGWSLETLS